MGGFILWRLLGLPKTWLVPASPRLRHEASRESFGVAGLYCPWSKLHWISLIQTCKQISTRCYQYQYEKKQMKNPWRWLSACSLTFSVTAGAGRCPVQRQLSWSSGATELWQHPGHVGPGESQSLLAIDSIPAGTQRRWTAAHLWLLGKADVHLCGVRYRARMYSQSSLSIGEHWTQVTPVPAMAMTKRACDWAVSCCTGCQSIVPAYLYSSFPPQYKSKFI